MHLTSSRGSSPVLMALVIAALVAACSSATGGSSPSSSPAVGGSALPTAIPTATAGASPAASASLDEPSANPPGGGVGAVRPRRVVTPKPGQLGVHPIPAESFSAAVQGRKVVLEVGYSIGVEPCYVLDSIDVSRGDHTFAITLREGHGPGDQVCIQIAELVRSFVDLGTLAPGTYTITDTQKGAPPITVTVA